MKRLICLLLIVCLSAALWGCSFGAPQSDEDVMMRQYLVLDTQVMLSGFDSLSQPQKVVYTAAALEAEVMNGGLCQFFANSSGISAGYVSEALELLGAAEHKELYDRFVADNGIDVTDLSQFQTDSIEEFSALYDLYPWDDFDTPYCELPPISSYVAAYIEANPDAFT